MMTVTPPTTSSGHRPSHAGLEEPHEDGGGAQWIEPGTGHVYPTSYRAYRRAREAEEKSPPRHRRLGPDIDHYLWRQGRSSPATDVVLIIRSEAPPRVRRMVAEVLRAIRGGRHAPDAIREVSRRFGLRQTRVRACMSASLTFEMQPRLERDGH